MIIQRSHHGAHLHLLAKYMGTYAFWVKLQHTLSIHRYSFLNIMQDPYTLTLRNLSSWKLVFLILGHVDSNSEMRSQLSMYNLITLLFLLTGTVLV